MTTHRGKIITFYSYKGGTGRSMALANVAWILASAGRRVLVIDWDLEAPGLHRYFSPFIEDRDLADTPGLIEMFMNLSEAARTADPEDAAWFEPLADIEPYAFSLDWSFPGEGTIDFVPAGRQGPGYAVNIGMFNWTSFYRDLGGGIFLEALKARIRQDYDFVLIDSRTGLSDTSGICTVQMPDELVVLFTLNGQSIRGARAVADSAIAQRTKVAGEPGLRVWPVPTRVELSDKERLEAARNKAREGFHKFLLPMRRSDRGGYWGRVEIPYDTYYAYEEVLATFADRPQQRISVLAALESLTWYLSDHTVRAFQPVPESQRRATLARFVPPAPSSLSRAGYLLVVDASGDEGLIRWLVSGLGARLGRGALLHETESKHFEALLQGAASLLVVVSRFQSQGALKRAATAIELAMKLGIRLVPLLFGMRFSELEKSDPLHRLTENIGFDRLVVHEDDEILMLAEKLRPALDREIVDPEDPNKGRFGGRAESNGRSLEGRVRRIGEAWFAITLWVSNRGGAPLEGDVVFHLHPTFAPSVRHVRAEGSRAEMRVHGYGAFTVGATADDGRTRLELDLAMLDYAPQAFRER